MNWQGLPVHGLAWEEFDRLAAGFGDADVVRTLRGADRSRRLLLLRALVDELAQRPELRGPLPAPDVAWELLSQVERVAPHVLERVLAHPYVGTWAGYTIRLIGYRRPTEHPVWLYTGYLHAVAAAAAAHARIPFETRIPLWHGRGMLPTLGMACFPDDTPCSVADVYGNGDQVEIRTPAASVYLPRELFADAPCWWGMRHLVAETDLLQLAVRLDDLDPYRSLTGPLPPRRLDSGEVTQWQALFDEAWRLIVRLLPDLARAFPAGLDSLSPRPAVHFGSLSASTGEAFGSAIIARPADAETFAAALVHEFQHIRLSGLLRLTDLHEGDPRKRFYTPWRDDPRPIGGVLHGAYAFFGVTAFWRALAASGAEPGLRRAMFEFARWRTGTWLVLRTLADDPVLTRTGRRFVARIAERLEPWQDEPVPADIADLAAAVAADHRAGWRMGYVRPAPKTVTRLAAEWLAGRTWSAGLDLVDNQAPASNPDGPWSPARVELIRLTLTEAGPDLLPEVWAAVPGATAADFAYAAGRFDAAVRGYRADLAADPDRPAAWIGLGLSLSAAGTEPTAARVLLRRPELVRAVYRRIRRMNVEVPAAEQLAGWIGERTR